MRFRALAADFDGTLAHDGIVDAATVEALQRLGQSGVRVVLVTGRELASLFNTFARCDVFDCIVAENGAVLYHPATQVVTTLTAAAPAALVERLQRLNVPISVGHSIVATVSRFEEQARTAIRELALPWHIILNKGSVMMLPNAVNKVTGLGVVLRELSLSGDEVVGVGDAENDCAFLRMCGLPVAVDNALPEVKRLAYVVTSGARGAGVCELIEQWLTPDPRSRFGPWFSAT